MLYSSVAALILGTLLWALPLRLFATELNLTVTLDYRILDRALEEQRLSDPGKAVELLADSSGCNSLRLSSPRIEGADGSQIRILTDLSTRTGIPTGNHCMLPLEWKGVVETLHQAYIDQSRPAIHIRTTNSNILKSDEQARAVPGVIWDWIKNLIQPRFDAVSIDLSDVTTDLEALLRLTLKNPQSSESPPLGLAFMAVTPTPAGLDLLLRLQVPDAPSGWQPASDRVLSAEELTHWDSAWQSWDSFATWLIKTLAITAEPELANALADILLQARFDLRDALADDDRARDPVRDLFLNTWERLAPLLHDIRLDIPGVQALQYATFISAADALSALDRVAPHLGMQLDRHSLRSLARLLVPTVSDADLEYDTDVDPALRKLLGLDPELNMDEPDNPPVPLAWLIPASHASQISPALVTRLTGWVPATAEINDYLGTMAQLLDQVVLAERRKGKVPGDAFDIYATLLRTTAWQESCWRQFTRKDGEVRTIVSPGGAIGLMQINRHVWRGLYNIDSLSRDVGYNARAGNEILVHYLVDFAIKRKEDEIGGDPRALARAAYGVYNGGPRHLSRYRKADTSRTLQAVDMEFWRKYQAMEKQGTAAVKACYGV
ncbi:lytic transglycosylase domain-containing protein [Marinobacterium sedimentorum]|uniref:lytic transglycosylase domain-containing protein n=1 Tax=Marinobacterium sedimentorum TaxID=2927804 RepID=UPI0020C69589|nr:lytic transglycosylase domain-containing protein [Marinobacterium sedimentorum]MCP8688910.1 lytic transglycosylase domain-containing protein [Marinobacterium sedimentorum]